MTTAHRASRRQRRTRSPSSSAAACGRTGRRRGVSGRAVAVGVVLLLLLGAGAVAAVTVLPTADITVTPRIETIGPIEFSVTADPAATTVDPEAGVIPATTVQVPVTVSGEFPATGTKVVREKATGGVRFTNCDPSSAYTIPSGSVVSTRSGIGFELDEAVFLPVAGISGSPPNVSVRCSTSEVAVTAAKSGPDGNVGAGEIRVVPARYNRNLVRVTNPSATTGGSREEFPEVTQQDVDAAIAKLDEDALAQFQADLDDPATLPEGTTVFPETAVIGELTPDVDPTTLVEQQVETFTLSLSGAGSAQAVDASPIEAIAAQRLEDAIGEGYELVRRQHDDRDRRGERRRRHHHVPGRRQREAGPAARRGGARARCPRPVAGGRRGGAGRVRRGRHRPVARVRHERPDDRRPRDGRRGTRGGPGCGEPDAQPAADDRARVDGRAGCLDRPRIRRRSRSPRRTRNRASRYHPADAPPVDDPAAARLLRRSRARRVTRILGIDLGSKRIGLAVADAGIGIARPLATVNRGATLDADIDVLGGVCREQDVTELVIGLPVEAAGDEGTMAAAARAWAAAIGERLAPAGHAARRAPVLVRGRAPARADAPRPVGRPAVAHPAQRLPGANRSRGRERHPPGRAGRAPRGRAVERDGGPMSIRGGRGPRDPSDGGYRNGYQRTGRYGRGPG